jgi:hypothetical protein
MGSPENEDDMRFADKELAQFRQEFNDHLSDYNEQQQAQRERMDELISAQKANTEAIASLIEETRGVVQLHSDIQGTVRLGRSLQAFGLWVAKWGVVGVAFAAAWNWLLQGVPKVFK